LSTELTKGLSCGAGVISYPTTANSQLAPRQYAQSKCYKHRAKSTLWIIFNYVGYLLITH